MLESRQLEEFRQLHFKDGLCRVSELIIQKVSRMGDSSPARLSVQER